MRMLAFHNNRQLIQISFGGYIKGVPKNVNRFGSEVEAVSAEIKVGNYEPFIVTSLYRPP